MNRALQLIVLFLSVSIASMGQPLPCFDFESFPANTQLGPASGNSPGDVLFSEAGIEVSIHEILYPDGSAGFGNAMIYDASAGWLDGQFLLMGNNSLQFDLSQAGGALNQLCFDFFDGGGVENFAINGSSAAIVQNFSEIAGLSFPGVTVEVDLVGDSTLEWGSVCIAGDIRSLLIGGQEFGIDNVCAQAVLACPIANLRAEVVSCDDAGNYNVEVDFDWLSPLTVIASFDIFVEGERVASIDQTQLPYLLEGVQPATDALVFTLTVCQSGHPDCCASVIVQKQCPPAAGPCVEFEGLGEASYGSSTGTPAGTEIYNESDIGLLLIPFQSLFWTTTYGDLLVLNTVDNPEMAAASGQYLRFDAINAVFDLTGFPDPVDSVVVDFYYAGGPINIAANGATILIRNALAPGAYALAPGITLLVSFDASSANEGQLTFVGDIQSLLIGGAGDFRIDNLCVNPVTEPCRLGNMTVGLGPCNDDGSFPATIDFDYQGASDSFTLDWLYGQQNFAYSDLPVTIGPIPANNTGIYAFYAADLEEGGCRLGDTIQAVPCTGCAFQGLSVDYLGLADNGQNAIRLDFELTGPTLADFFTVYFDGELYGRFNWSEAPLELLVPCNTAAGRIQEITVCEGEDHCCVTLPLLYLEPCQGPCAIRNVQVRAGPCNADNAFEVKLDLDYRNTSDSFELWLNGNATGRFFAYADLPVVAGTFTAPTPELEFGVVDAGFRDCSGSAILPAYDCGPPCFIERVEYHLTDCNDAGNYFIVISHIIPDPPNLAFLFYVSVDGQLYGAYSSADLPIELGPFPGNGEPHEVSVHTGPADPTDPNVACSYVFATEPVFCNDNCPLESVELVGDILCDQDSTNRFYRAKLRVAGPAVGDVLVIRSAISGFSMTTVYNGEPVVVEMPVTGQFFDNLLVCLPVTSVANDCCLEIAFDIPCPAPCPWLGGVTISPNGCRNDGSYTAMLNITTPAPAVDVRFVVESGDYREEFTFAALPVEIGPFFGDGEPRTVHVVIPGTDCHETVTFLAPDCTNGGCLFTRVIVEPHSCDGGKFLADVEVRVSNPGALGYLIFADGMINGPYSYNEPFVTVGPFEGDGTTVYDFLILDIEDPTCFGYAELGPVDCSDGCEIFDVVVDPLDCNPDGTYNAFLNFEVANPGNDFFEVFGPNGELLGFYDLASRPVIVSGLHPTASGEGRLKVCINDRPDCCRSVSFPEPDCTGNCRIYDVRAEFAYCDDAGNFYVQLHFNFENPAADGYRVFGNGQDYGTYGYNEPFPVIGPFSPAGAPAYELVVADLANPDCRGFVVFDAFDCNDDQRVCITFDEFETLPDDTVGLAIGHPRDSIYDEDGVVLNAVAVPLVNNTNFFEAVYGWSSPQCNFDTDGGNLWVNGGIGMNFSHLAALPTTITFDVSFCSSSTAIPQIVIGANGELYSGSIAGLPDELPGGISLEFVPFNNAGLQGQIRLHGPVETLVIGGRWIFIDNICFNQPPPVSDDCVSFDVYDGTATDTLANYNHPEEMEYEEDGVVATALAIEWNGLANYFTGVYIFDNDNCGFADDDAALSVGGALRFDFAGLASLPVEVTFELAICQGQTSAILLNVNGESYRGLITALPAMLPNGIRLSAVSASADGRIWKIRMEGTIENFMIGGGAVTIDNVCFNAPPQEEEVWPGDANADNIAHHVDLLNIGLAYGFQGTPRFVDGANWMGFMAADWPQAFANGANYKHADCNGDGVVDNADRLALRQNYGLTHGPPAPLPELPGADTDPPAYVDFPGIAPVGASFNVPIVVGTEDLPVEDVYGIAFTVVFDPEVLDAGAMNISYPVSWFGEPGVNALSIDRTYADEGRIEMAITRIDQNNVSGFGPVAYLIGIIDDIAGLKPDSEVSIENIVAIARNEERIPLQGRAVQFELQHKEEEAPADARGMFSLFPNPATDWVTVASKYGYQPEQLTLLSFDGREISAPQEENRRISLAGLPSGTYVLSIRTGDTRVHKLIVKE